jgi:hypothetical protein
MVCLTSLFVTYLPATVIITEIMYNPAGEDVPFFSSVPYETIAQEWVEIYNAGSETVDVTGWKLRDEDSNAGNWGTLSGTLAPSQVGVITTSHAAAFKASWPSAHDAVIFTVPGWGSLANSVDDATNEVLTLLDADNVIVDVVNYQTIAPWPVRNPNWTADKHGPSIYLLPGHMNSEYNDQGINWAWSIAGFRGAIHAVYIPGQFNIGSIGSPGIISTDAPANSHANSVIDVFGHDLFKYESAKSSIQSQWYFSFQFKLCYHFGDSNWMWFQEFDSIVYVVAKPATYPQGFWGWVADIGVLKGGSGWIWFSSFTDLLAMAGDDPIKATEQKLTCYFYVQTGEAIDHDQGSWYYFSEFTEGNWALNLSKYPDGASSANWIRIGG